MSCEKSERYLSRLRAQLKLPGAQRDSILNELRDHLLDRCEELQAGGMSQDEAVELAVAEFGDVADLASQFSSLLHSQRKRWMMKLALGTTAVSLGTIWMAFAFWPPNPVVKLSPVVIAQDEDPFGGEQSTEDLSAEDPFDSNGSAPATNPTAETDEMPGSPTLQTEAKLATRVAADFYALPLEDVLRSIGATHDLQIYIDSIALDDWGVPTDSLVTLQLDSVRLDTMLDLTFKQLDLAYKIQDGIIIVTTPDELESNLEVRVYNCRDLMPKRPTPGGMGGMGMEGMGGMGAGMMGGGMGMGAMGGGDEDMMRGMMGGGGYDEGGDGGGYQVGSSSGAMRELTTLIQATVNPSTWENVGGPGTIAGYSGLVVIHHDAGAHRKVESLLRMLRHADEQGPGSIVRP